MGAPLDISEEFPFTSTDYYRDISPSQHHFMSTRASRLSSY